MPSAASAVSDHSESLPLASGADRTRCFASVESIDFDVYESERATAVKATKRKQILQTLAKWAAVALIGVATGCVASGIDYGIVQLTQLRFGLMRVFIEQGLGSELLILANVAICTSLASFAGSLVCFVSPLAAGSGIPEVKCRLNGLDLNGVVKPQTLLAKACGVLFSVSAGLPCGKEGPMIHSGSIIGALLANTLHGAPSSTNSHFSEIRLSRDRDERDLIAAGGAAGA